MEDNELYHYGRKGMKWYQNIFTKGELGRSRKKRDRTGNENDSPETSKSSSSSSSSKKSIRDMTNEELKSKTDRYNAEKNYLDAQRAYEKALKEQYSDLNPQKVSKGKELVKKYGSKVVDEVVVPAALDIGKQVLKSAMAKYANDRMKDKGMTEFYQVYTNNKKKDK